VIAPELPSDDPGADLIAYASLMTRALEHAGDDVVVVGHSLGGLTAPLVADMRPTRRLVLLCGLVPVPGRSLVEELKEGPDPFAPGAGAGRERDELGRSFWTDEGAASRILYSDCGDAVAAAAFARLRPQAQEPQIQPCPLREWPAVPTTYVFGTADRMISPAWVRATAAERLSVEPLELQSGHSPMLSHPAQLAALLDGLAG
jgi:pimeloyl-ACP methyl ester carboxylesterase